MATVKRATVYIHLGETTIPAGILTTRIDGRYTSSEFVYGNRYIERSDAVPIDPCSLPLPPPGRSEVYRTRQDFAVFNGVRDASPDKWGRYLLDRKFPKVGLDEFDYIAASGPDRVGALAFGATPVSGIGIWNGREFEPVVERHPDLAQIQRAVDHADDPEDPDFRTFLEYGPSLGGARPKGTVIWNDNLYLAKFSLSSDSWNICTVEHATMRLAARCGITIPPVATTEILGRSVYLIERFDRGNAGRVPFCSALTMTDSHEADYGRHSYQDIVTAITRFSPCVEADRTELFRRMVFNIFCANSDDHLRNHGFLYAGDGLWRLSPAYDIVPFPQSTDTWTLALQIGCEGRLATVDNALSAAPLFGLRPADAALIVEKIRENVRHWRDLFSENGVRETDMQRIAGCFRDL
jgi:serine/threonine-protein kinase HipA